MDPTPKQPEEDDVLWELMGKARPPQASPFFAARVVNAARSESRERSGFLWAFFRPAFAAAFAGIIVLTVVLAFQSTEEKSLADQDFETIVDLDNLIAMDQQNLWTDSSVYSNY